MLGNCISQQLTKQMPERPRTLLKYAPNKCCRQHPELLKSDLDGASYGHFTETVRSIDPIVAPPGTFVWKKRNEKQLISHSHVKTNEK